MVSASQNVFSNKAAYPGAAMGITALFLPFLSLKANRVIDGVRFTLWDGLPRLFFLSALFLLLAALLIPKSDKSNFYLWTIGTGLLTLILTALSLAGGHLGLEQYPYGRISPSSGFWLLLASSFLLMNFHRKWYRQLPWIILLFLFTTGQLEDIGFIKEFRNGQERFFSELINHMVLSLRAVGSAVVIGVPAGILAWKKKILSNGIFAFVNALQTVPSLALFGLLIAPLAFLGNRYPFLRELGLQGVGRTPALIALTLYALLPIVRNTFTSLAVIDRKVLDAGRGMGMTTGQLFCKVELPMAIPVILSGIRVSLVQTTGNTTVAALIGAGGLGYFVFRGLEQAAPDLIIMGVIPIILLVVLLDKLFGRLIRVLTPDGLEALYDTP